MSDNTELKAAIEYILNQGALEREFIEDADALDAAWALYEALGPAEILALIAENDAARKELGSLRTDNAQLIYALKQQEQSYLVLRGERDRLRAEVAGLRTGYEAYEQVNAELKAENDAIRAAYMASGEREHELRVERETLRKAVTYAVDMFSRVSSGDGSGHADIGRAVLRIAGAALGQGEKS